MLRLVEKGGIGMGETKDNSQGQSRGQSVDADAFLDLNFVPAWARKPPDSVHASRYSDQDRNAKQHGDRRGRRTRDTQRQDGGRRGEGQRGDRETARRPRDGGKGSPDPRNRQDQRPKFSRRDEPRKERQDLATVTSNEDVTALFRAQFFPERKAITELAKRIGAVRKAYPLLDLAHLLMEKEGLCYVRLEAIDPAVKLFQCKICKLVDRDRASLEKHISTTHLSDYFDSKTETVDPPSGVFVCVAICGLSGELLGPPNHHSYADAVQTLHAERYSHMSIDAYRSKIRTSHAPEDVERWKESCTRKVVYQLKAQPADGEEHQTFSEKEAQRYMHENVVGRSIKEQRSVVLSEPVARSIQDPAIRSILHMAWQKEIRFPIQVALALRAALRHRKLHVFKAGPGKGMHFVTSVKPEALDPETAIPEIRETLRYLAEHPGCTRKEVVHDLLGDLPKDHPDVKARLQPITWLVDKGHIIEFFDGRLAVPRHV
jgi:hypothetical protein